MTFDDHPNRIAALDRQGLPASSPVINAPPNWDPTPEEVIAEVREAMEKAARAYYEGLGT